MSSVVMKTLNYKNKKHRKNQNQKSINFIKNNLKNQQKTSLNL